MNDAFVRFIQFENIRTKSCIVIDEDCNLNIYIDERLSDKAKVDCYWHEMQHYLKGHFGDDVNITDAERIL